MVLNISNHYYTTIWVTLQFFDPNCDGDQFKVVGWFQFEPGETNFANVIELSDLRKVGSTHFYFYAEAADGSVWTSDRFSTAVPNDVHNRCDTVNNKGDRILNFREIIIKDFADFNLSFVPGDLNPIIDVHTKFHQLGGFITVTGDEFTPLSQVNLMLENITGTDGPILFAITHTNSRGHFEVPDEDVRCINYQCEKGPVTIRAIDTITGASATGLTGAYCCGLR